MSPYSQLLIYVFSGTGNALKASRWITACATEHELTTNWYNIEHTRTPELPEPQGRTLIGFCYPTHGFIAPWLVLKFMWQFPRIANAEVFFLNTRAGFGLYRIHHGPGLSGLAQWWPILLFACRGFRVVGSLPLDMPHSWISFFWPNTKRQISYIVARCERITNEFASSVVSGKRYFRWSIWLTLPLDLALAPICVLYLIIGRFYLAKTLFASHRCDNCQLCIKNCPVSAIELVSGRPFWKTNCESCMRCMNICPKKAIQSWITRIVALTIGLYLLGSWFIPLNGLKWLVILSVLFFPLYRLLHELWRVRVANQLFASTSLTRYWHRYLAPGVTVKDFRKRN